MAISFLLPPHRNACSWVWEFVGFDSLLWMIICLLWRRLRASRWGRERERERLTKGIDARFINQIKRRRERTPSSFHTPIYERTNEKRYILGLLLCCVGNDCVRPEYQFEVERRTGGEGNCCRRRRAKKEEGKSNVNNASELLAIAWGEPLKVPFFRFPPSLSYFPTCAFKTPPPPPRTDSAAQKRGGPGRGGGSILE